MLAVGHRLTNINVQDMRELREGIKVRLWGMKKIDDPSQRLLTAACTLTRLDGKLVEAIEAAEADLAQRQVPVWAGTETT